MNVHVREQILKNRNTMFVHHLLKVFNHLLNFLLVILRFVWNVTFFDVFYIRINHRLTRHEVIQRDLLK